MNPEFAALWKADDMRKRKLTDKKIKKLVDEITHTYKDDSGINFIDAANLPVRGDILEILDLLFEVLFPGHTGKRSVTESNIKFVVGDILCQVYAELCDQIERAYRYQCRIKKCDDCDCQTMARLNCQITKFCQKAKAYVAK